MPGIVGFAQCELGKETTLGTAVASTARIRGKARIKDESEPVYVKEEVGIIGGVGRSYTPKEHAAIEFDESEASFEQLPYFFNMGIKGSLGVADGAGTGFVYTYPFPALSVTTPFSYTARIGDNQQAEIVTGIFVEEITISGAAEEAWMRSATGRGWITSTPTTAFTGSIAVPTVEDIIFGKTKLFIDAIGGTMGATQILTSFLSFSLSIKNIYKAQWTGDGTHKNFTFIKMVSDPEIVLEFTLEHDATAVAERAIRRARTERKIRVQGLGSTLVTPGAHTTKKVNIDLIGSYDAPEELDDEDSNMVVKFTFRDHYSSTAAARGSIVVVNSLSALP